MKVKHRTGQGSLASSGRWGMALVVAFVTSACGSSDPDANSGGDAYRNEAQPMPLDEMVTGELDLDTGDQTDWKSTELESAGKATVTLTTDKKGASVSVAVYDKYGTQVATGTKKGGSEEPLVVKFKAASDDKYFVRIQHRGGSKTTYSVQLGMGEGGGGGAVPDI